MCTPGLTIRRLGVLLVVGLLQFVIGNVIDPMLMGGHSRLSSFGIIISLAFGARCRGLPGMFLAVPIMVAVMIVFSTAVRPLAVVFVGAEGLPDRCRLQQPRLPAARHGLPAHKG